MTSQLLTRPGLGANLGLRVHPLLRNQTLLAALILTAVLGVFYHDVIFEGRTFLMESIVSGVTRTGPYNYTGGDDVDTLVGDGGAIGWAMEPWSFLINQLYKQGELPLWNPHQGLGTPLLGSAQPAPFDPLLLIVHLAPTALWPVAVDLHLLLRYFLAGFFSYLFMRSIGVGFAGGLAAGISFMLCGYFLFYGNIAYVRADALLPMLVFAYDRLALKPTRRSFVFSILALWLIVVTGFPETLPLHVGLAGLWYLVRTLALSRQGRWPAAAVIRRLGWLAVSGLSAGLLAAFVLVPFVETAIHAEHIHYHGSADPEMTYAPEFLPTLLTAILPTERSIGQIPNVLPLGIIPLTLALYAAVRAARPDLRPRFLAVAALFFSGMGAALLLVTFRGPLLAWVADLPGFSSIIMWKYPQVLIAFCIACAAGVGVHFWQTDSRRFTHLVAAIALLVTVLLLLVGDKLENEVEFETMAPLGMVVLLFGLLVVFALAQHLRVLQHVIVYAVVALLVAEPLLWFGDLQRPVRAFPYDEPPYLSVLRASGEEFRVIGLDRELYPNTASTFGVDDIRYLDALHPLSYLDFARRFVISPEVRRRFTGVEPVIQFNRGMNFLNVQYVVAASGGATLQRHLSGVQFDDDYAVTELTLEDQTARALDLDVDSSVSIGVRVPSSQRTVLDVAFGVDELVTACGCFLEDGVTFGVHLRTPQGPLRLMQRLVDPIRNPDDRGWLIERLDLTRWAGQTVTLDLTRTTSTGENDLAYAHWVAPKMISAGHLFPWLDDAAAENPQMSITRWLSFTLESIDVGGDTRLAVRQHPPGQATLSVTIPERGSRLEFGIGYDPRLWTDEFANAPLGDGATYRVTVDDGSREQVVFEQYIDPKNVPEQRRWLDASVDLSPWAGQRVTLAFSTDGGPAGDTTYDWAYWSDIHLSGDQFEPALALVNDATQFTEIYDDGQIAVFRNELAYPRAYVVRNAEVVDSTEAALDRFGESNFNPTTSVVLTGPLTDTLAAQVAALPSELLADHVDVIDERANSMRLEANLSAPGLLVVSELDYPGWHAWVDGVEQPIIQANGVARAVYLDTGQHTIEFTYIPLAFWLSLGVSLVTLAALAVGLVLWGRRPRAATPSLAA